jgi:hypothetical protein
MSWLLGPTLPALAHTIMLKAATKMSLSAELSGSGGV